MQVKHNNARSCTPFLQEDQTPQLWISLYYVDGYHFQALVFEILGQCHCFFRDVDLPEPLRQCLT